MADGTKGFVFQDITGKIWATPPPREFMSEDVPPPPGPIVFYGPQGAQTLDPRTQTVSPPIPGTENAAQTEAANRQQAQAALATLEQASKDIDTRANQQVPHFQGLPVNTVRLTDARNKEAVAAGYASWQDLLDQLAAARKAVGAPPGGVTPQRAAPTPTPSGKGGPAKSKGQIEKDKLDRMLQMLRQ